MMHPYRVSVDEVHHDELHDVDAELYSEYQECATLAEVEMLLRRYDKTLGDLLWRGDYEPAP